MCRCEPLHSSGYGHMADGFRAEPAVHRTAGFLVLAAVIGMDSQDLTVIPVEVRPPIAGPRPARDRLAPVGDGSLVPQGRPSPREDSGSYGNRLPKATWVTVILLPEPPALTPEAARILLRILVEASEKQAADKAHPGVGDGQQPGDH
jgi:hypothetical protein